MTLLRGLSGVFQAGDVLLSDCLIGNWRCLYETQQQGVAMVTRLNKALRTADFRLGQRLGKEDHLVRWPKPHRFKGALQTLEAFQPLIDFQGHRGREFRTHLYGQLLDAVATHRVANRPDRFEPRRRKRRPPLYGYLHPPRNQAKLEMIKGVKKN